MEKFWKTLRWPPRRRVLWHSIAAIPMATVVALGAWLSYHVHQLTIQTRDRVDRLFCAQDDRCGSRAMALLSARPPRPRRRRMAAS